MENSNNSNSDLDKSEYVNSDSRREFLKLLGGSTVFLGASSLIPNAGSFSIRSENDLSYFSKSRSKSAFEVDSSGTVDVNQIGEDSNPISEAFMEKTRSESIYTNSRISAVIVHKEGDYWVASGEKQEIGRSKDPGDLINSALDTTDTVHVTSEQGRTTMKISNTIELTSGFKTLKVDPGIRIKSDGFTTPIHIAGNNTVFHCGRIDANGSDIGVRSLGLGPGDIRITEIKNARKTAFYYDGENSISSVANGNIQIGWINCNGSTKTDKGIFYDPGPENKSEGDRIVCGVILNPAEKGVQIGNSSNPGQTGYIKAYVDVDGANNSPDSLVDIHSPNTGVVLEGYIRSEGNHDIIFRDTAEGSTLTTLGGAKGYPLRIRKETPHAKFRSGSDKYGQRYQELDTSPIPDSLDGYKTGGADLYI